MKNKVDSGSYRVLVVPLNWGLGHATRLIPLISELKNNGTEVILGGSHQHLSLLKQEFGELETVKLPYLRIYLSQYPSQILLIALQVPLIFLYIIREHFSLKKIIKEKKIDLLISDNCFGLWNRAVYSVFITHQLYIEVPQGVKFLSRMVNRMNRWFISRHNESWVPDEEKQMGFAGKLSHPPIPGILTSYLGILSRFHHTAHQSESQSVSQKKILIIISGPEKQRSVFEKIVSSEIHLLPGGYSCEIIRGLPGHQEELPMGWHHHVDSYELSQMITNAEYIICRSGYSTIMDLITLNRTAMLVPTPGQSEQEYLARYLCSKNYFSMMEQSEFNLVSAIRLLEERRINLPALSPDYENQLSKIIRETINRAIKVEIPQR